MKRTHSNNSLVAGDVEPVIKNIKGSGRGTKSAKACTLTPSQILLEIHLRELNLPFEREFAFHPHRKWRFDYILKGSAIALEIEGGVWSQGRHTRGKGYLADMEKYREATMMGYRVLRFATQEIMDGRAKAWLAEWLK